MCLILGVGAGHRRAGEPEASRKCRTAKGQAEVPDLPLATGHGQER